jgi:hypothetical protein
MKQFGQQPSIVVAVLHDVNAKRTAVGSKNGEPILELALLGRRTIGALKDTDCYCVSESPRSWADDFVSTLSCAGPNGAASAAIDGQANPAIIYGRGRSRSKGGPTSRGFRTILPSALGSNAFRDLNDEARAGKGANAAGK